MTALIARVLSSAREIGVIWCTDSAIRILARRMLLPKLGKRGVQQLIESSALLNLKFLNEFAAL